MNIVTWNVRGLGRASKRSLVKDFLKLHFVDVCCLQESKLEDISSTTWREIGGVSIDQFSFLPVRRSAGGVILGCNSLVVSGQLVQVGVFSLMVDFCSKRDSF